eukprot:12871082-Prorocentrum_lima.AAC.1
MSELSHKSPGRVKHCVSRLDSRVTEKIDKIKEEADPEDNVQLHYLSLLLDNIHKNEALARAADW